MRIEEKSGVRAAAGEAAEGWRDKLLVRLGQDYPELKFRLGKKFTFRPARTIIVESPCEEAGGAGENEQNYYDLQVLHEVGHALLGHRDFGADVERLKMERAAWEKARELCGRYNIYYDEDFVEEKLDTYREWLHQKSRCPGCGLTRYQGRNGKYRCPSCEAFFKN